MTQKTAHIIFFVFNVLAFFAVAYVVNDFISVNDAVNNKKEIIPFDSGMYYLLLITVFWVFSIIQYAGLKQKDSVVLRYANQFSIAWFVFMLLLANIIPYYLSNKIESAGYALCDDPKEISRIAKGKSILYKKNGC